MAYPKELDQEILNTREKVMWLAESEETRRFYEKEMEVARTYFEEKPSVPTPEQKPVPREPDGIMIYDLKADPDVVSPGGYFDLSLTFRISDSKTEEQDLPYTLTLTILKDSKVIESSDHQLLAPRGKRYKLTRGFPAAAESGTYEIRIILQYKDKIVGKSLNLEVKRE